MLWRDKYALGVPAVDEQHRELFLRVESFVTTLRLAEEWEEKVQRVNETLEFMKSYVVEHFCDEEAYQQRIGYPGYPAHKKAHDDMVAYVLSVSEEYMRSGCDEQLMQRFAGKLLAWLINHVADDDQQIAAYAATKGVSCDAV